MSVGRGVGGPGPRRLILAAAGLLIAAVAAAWLLARPAVRPSTGLAAPPLQAGSIPCRRDPMAGAC